MHDELLEAINKIIDNAKNVNVWHSCYKSTYCFETVEEAFEALFDE